MRFNLFRKRENAFKVEERQDDESYTDFCSRVAELCRESKQDIRFVVSGLQFTLKWHEHPPVNWLDVRDLIHTRWPGLPIYSREELIKIEAEAEEARIEAGTIKVEKKFKLGGIYDISIESKTYDGKTTLSMTIIDTKIREYLGTIPRPPEFDFDESFERERRFGDLIAESLPSPASGSIYAAKHDHPPVASWYTISGKFKEGDINIDKLEEKIEEYLPICSRLAEC